MARRFFPLLALMICVTYGGGSITVTLGQDNKTAGEGGMEALCKNTVDDKYCIHLLSPLVVASTNFSSLKWNKAVMSKAMTKARQARDFMTRQAELLPNLDFKQHAALKDCLDNLDGSVESLHLAAREYVQVYNYYGTQDFDLHKAYVHSLMEKAALDQGHCYSSLSLYKMVDGPMEEILQKAEHALKANKIAQKIVLLITLPQEKLE